VPWSESSKKEDIKSILRPDPNPKYITRPMSLFFNIIKYGGGIPMDWHL
jgi:hypothetical protein